VLVAADRQMVVDQSDGCKSTFLVAVMPPGR